MDVKDGIGPLTDEDGNVISDNKDMAQVLNQYFPTVLVNSCGSSLHFPAG